MYFYKLVIAYDGTDYYGWQWQNNNVTIEHIVRKTFLGVFHQKKMELVAASRTDRGVHAHGQVLRLGSLLSLDSGILHYALSRALPDAITIRSCDILEDKIDFHPQHNIIKKVYIYRFFLFKPLPEHARYAHVITTPFDVDRCRQALSLFIGTHDFVAFSKELAEKDTVRTVDDLSITICQFTGAYIITVVGKSFLRHMIRRIVGAAFEYAGNALCSLQDIKDALNTGIIKKNLPVAPAKGLCLKEIQYKK